LDLHMRGETLWKFGSRLLFGQMYEDAEIERRAFPANSRVFAIASAGCTAFALARDHDVTAVDLNRAQIEYARRRAAGARVESGAIDWILRTQIRALIVAGWTPARLDRFLQFSDCEEQLAFWHARLNTPLFRGLAATKLACDSLAVRFLTRDPGFPVWNLGELLRRRLERGFARHANSENPYAQRMFRGTPVPANTAGAASIRFETADAVAFLESAPAGSFDAFALSNIADGATVTFRERLLRAVRHAASDHAIAVLRSLREPEDEAAAEFAARDRAMLWGSIQVTPARALR
jgi:S-adenosylmethionine:diacylglycerol 3-amino-3-carboxypropyl transferase